MSKTRVLSRASVVLRGYLGLSSHVISGRNSLHFATKSATQSVRSQKAISSLAILSIGSGRFSCFMPRSKQSVRSSSLLKCSARSCVTWHGILMAVCFLRPARIARRSLVGLCRVAHLPANSTCLQSWGCPHQCKTKEFVLLQLPAKSQLS